MIPLKSNQKTSAALATLRSLQNTLEGEEEPENGKENGSSESAALQKPSTLEERVIKELLNEAKGTGSEDDQNQPSLSLPLQSNETKIDGAKESTIDDYEEIPITQFGMAMLRGMGLKDEEIRSKSSKEPELRAKGMGLGADKLVKPKKLLVAPASNETLEIKKNACVRILAGKFKDLYGIIEGLDEDAGRVVVKLALGRAREALNEFMVQPVSKQEYSQYGKVINSVKYDEYKKKQEAAEMQKKEGGSSRRRSPSPQNSKSNRNASSSNQRRPREHNERSRDSRLEREEGQSKDHGRRDDRERRRSPSGQRRDRSKSAERYSRKANVDSQKRDKTAKSEYKDKDRKNRSESSSSSSSSSSDSSRSRSHRKKTKKKHKKSSKSRHDDRQLKKKTKKSKRQRSRSRERY